MAREKQRREDLLRDAVAYKRRILLALEWQGCEFFAGQRAQAGWSLYFDESPVLQFDSVGELRRLFIDDRKLLVQGGRLVELRRATDQPGSRMVHDHHQLSSESEQEIQKRCREYLQRAQEAVDKGAYRLVGQVPSGDPHILTEVQVLLRALCER